MLGWQQADLLGHSFFAFVHPADVAATQGAMASLSEGRTVFQFQNRYRSRDGSYRWLAWSSVPDAGLIHAVGRDVTAEKEAALQLEATQERLRQAQRMEALGQLAGGIAHDFNNVLQSVTGGLTLIAKRAEDPASVRKLATMAGEAAARGASITGRLLSFARQGALQSVPVDPAALLEGLAEMLTHTLGPNIAVRTEAEAALPAFLADKAQLETALVNLAVNARDAMPEGGVLTISARADAATLARAGEPFFTTKPLGRGTGLGLAMARGFIEQSGGTIDIVSAPGEGTAVTLWLPQAPAASAPAPATAVALDPALPAATVLLVDDDTRVRLTLAEHLADVGYRVVQASDGLDAVTRLDSGQPIDLLITDFAMPGMNGLALIQVVRRRLPDLPVVLLTGFADVGVRDRLVHDPADGMVLLQKPIAPDDLAARAASLLKQWQQAAD
jgi:signal transduction histidine kinase/ActR/RegA family two-component response regulator